MNEHECKKIEDQGLLLIDSTEDGLRYIAGGRVMHKQKCIEICGIGGRTKLTRKMLNALIAELPDIAEMYC